MRSTCFIVASIAVSLTSAIFTYKKLLYVYPPTIYEYNEHLGGKYAENTIRCKKLDEILAKLKPLVDDNSKAELEAIFCFFKYNVSSETPVYNGNRNILLAKSKKIFTKENYRSIMPILKENIPTINKERQIFNAPFCQTLKDLSNVIPFLKENLNDYVIEVYRQKLKGHCIGMVFCYPKESVK